jgi:predicted Fe-Mo cluster-binding NifX family protein
MSRCKAAAELEPIKETQPMTTERIHIAIGIENEETLWIDHFGEAPFFAIYDHSGTLIALRANPYSGAGHEKKHHGNPQQIIALLPECGVFIAHSMGKRKTIAEQGIQTVLTTAQTPLDALQAYLANVD